VIKCTFSIRLACLGRPKPVHELEATDVDGRGQEEANDLGGLIGGTLQGHGKEVAAVGTQDHVSVEVDRIGIFFGNLFGTSCQLLAFLLRKFFHGESRMN